MREWYKIVNQGNMPVITIYGVIADNADDDTAVSYAQFQAAFRDLERTYTQCRICVNCMGGSLIEGLPMYDMVLNSPMDTDILVEGTAASFAAVFVQAGTTRRINSNGFMMIHAASGGTYGNAVTLRNYADTMDTMQARTRSILLERTGQSESVVDGWLTPGVDTWLDAEQCLKLGLVDEIVQSPTKRVVIPITNLAKRKPAEAYQYINNQLQIENVNMNKLKASLILMLALSGVELSIDDSDEKFADEVKKLFKSKDDAIVITAKNNATAIVAQSGLTLTDAEKETYINFGIVNPAALVTMLGKLKPVVTVPPPAATTIVNLNGGLERKAADDADDRSKWTFQDWSKNDSIDLTSMEASDPTKFNKLLSGITQQLKNRGIVE